MRKKVDARAGLGTVRDSKPLSGDIEHALTSNTNGGNSLPGVPKSPTRAEMALGILADAIASGQLIPDELYSVQMLAAQLGVSRTPVREALLQMARQGRVRFERNRGVRIVEPSVGEIAEIFQIRMWLEVPATKLATRRSNETIDRRLRKEFDAMVSAAGAGDQIEMWRRDRAFHRAILEASGNQRLAQYVDGLREIVLRRGETTAARRSRTPMEIANAHRPILAAILARQAAEAAAAMASHLNTTAGLLTVESGR